MGNLSVKELKALEKKRKQTTQALEKHDEGLVYKGNLRKNIPEFTPRPEGEFLQKANNNPHYKRQYIPPAVPKHFSNNLKRTGAERLGLNSSSANSYWQDGNTFDEEIFIEVRGIFYVVDSITHLTIPQWAKRGYVVVECHRDGDTAHTFKFHCHPLSVEWGEQEVLWQEGE